MSTQKEVSGAQKYVNAYIALAKPGAGDDLVAADLKRALTFRNMYEAKQTPKGDLEPEFGKVASAFVASLYGGSFGSADAARGMVNGWFAGTPEGQTALRRLYNAIEKGRIVAIEYELQNAYTSAIRSTKLQSVAADENNQPDDVRMGVAQVLAAQLGDVNGYKGSPVSVLGNKSAALGGLEQRLAIAESVSTTHGEGAAHH